MAKRVSFEEPVDYTVTTTAGSLFGKPLIMLNPGVNAWERVGTVVQPTRVQANIQLVFRYKPRTGIVAHEGQLYGQMCRLCLVWDRYPSGTIPEYNEVFNFRYTNGTQTTSYWSPVTNESNRFELLVDKYVALNPTMFNAQVWASSVGAEIVEPLGHYNETFITQLVKFDIPLHGRRTRFKHPPTAINLDVLEGQIYFFAISTLDDGYSHHDVHIHRFESHVEYNDS
jgi:hypothetical protein